MKRFSAAAALFALPLVVACGDDTPSATAADVDADFTDAADGGADATTQDTATRDVPPAEDTATDSPAVLDLGNPDTADDATPEDTGRPDVDPADTPDPAVCGNGVREPGEVCDGEEIIAGVDCVVQGFIGGELGCTDDCVFDVRGCYDALCGDELVSGSEDCDGGPGEDTCASIGFAPGGEGVLGCDDECAFDTDACEDFICGNENVEDGFEACDGDLFGDESCRSLGFYDGDLACAEDCLDLNDGACVENICGNGTVEGAEACDGPGSVPMACTDFEIEPDGGDFFTGGTLGCSEDCFEITLTDCLVDEISPDVDADLDHVTDDVDNCVGVSNPNQLDYDGDGVGNVCDEPVVFDVLLESETANIFTTNVSGAPGGGGLPIPLPGLDFDVDLDLAVLTATANVWFDDEGVMSVTLDPAVTFEDGAIDIAFDALPLPIPIPGLDGISIAITEGSMGVAEDGSFANTEGAATYSSGRFSGTNDPWDLAVHFSADASGTTSDLDGSATVETTTSVFSTFDGTFALEINEPELEIGTLTVNILIVDVEVAVVGFEGTLLLGLAAEEEGDPDPEP